MLHDRKAQPRPLFLGRIISLENAPQFVGRNARPVVAEGNFHRMIAGRPGGDQNISFFAKRLARVLQQVDENLRQMAALHEQWRKAVPEIAVEVYFARYGGRKNLRDGMLKFGDD